MNPRLADVVTKAKKMGFPKASIESSIARGQGISPNGLALENLTIEAMVPPSVAVIIECQTDSKLRTLSEMKLAVKEAGGTVTPTNHMFERRGRVVFENPGKLGEADMFDQAIEAGAVDIQIEEDGDIVVLTESSQTTAVAKSLSQSLDLKVKSSDVVWDPKEDMMVAQDSTEGLESFFGRHRNMGTSCHS